MTKEKIKWTGILSGALAGMLLLASVQGVYFYLKSAGNKDSLQTKIKTEISAPDTSKAINKLSSLADEIASGDSISHGTFSFCLATADSGKIIMEKNSGKSLVPASSLKIITTGIALKTAGTDYIFPTLLQYSGEINAATRTLNGNIYIKGSGDPTLGSEYYGGNTYDTVLQRWYRAIHNLGIDSIKGAVIGDGEIFDYDAVPGGWAWEDVEMDYGAPPAGLNFRDNCYDIVAVISKQGVSVSVAPPVPELKIMSAVICNPSVYKSYLFAAGPPFTSHRILRGEIKYQGVYRAPVSDPVYFCAYSLFRILEKNGITVSDSATTVKRRKICGNSAKYERRTITVTYSPPLEKIVKYTNHVSHNMYAEALLKLISVKKNNFGSTTGGVAEVYKYWKDKNIDMRGFYMRDGSGLSRANNFTAKQLTYFLVSFANDSAIFSAFYKSLPVYGVSLLINGPPPAPVAKLNIHAKGGYMSRVWSLAGYMKNKNGKLLVFTMIANNHEFNEASFIKRIENMLWLIAELD